MKVAIINYGMGNLKSVTGALQYIGVQNIIVSSNLKELMSVDKLVLPGVGSFSKAMQTIKDLHLDEYLHSLIFDYKKPILGICLGMQLMGTSSTEHGNHVGLGFIPGTINQFDASQIRVPHVGFNQVLVNPASRLYQGLTGLTDFYFTHSFKMNSSKSISQCYCDYGGDFIASYEIGNIVGVQFHPELSQSNGLRMLKNFIEHF